MILSESMFKILPKYLPSNTGSIRSLILKTWVGEATRKSFERHTEIIRGNDEKILAKVVRPLSSISSESRKSIVPN